ncbi:MAG: hypothetical protein DRP09_15965 [Candidatus Thorarchaeota archaeon]|nr:MAG: hypothetical protein DRP09_15965 [Candidatus Thorarchaeota archaeon]
MATVEEVVRDVLAAASTDAGYLVAVRWVNNRYKQLVSRVRFRHLREVAEVVIPASYKTGTVSINRGSLIVTGVGTLFVTQFTAGDKENLYIKISSAWYKIASVDSETQITLDSTFSEDDVSGGSFVIIQRNHSLASDVRWLGSFVHTRLRTKLHGPISQEELDSIAPGRTNYSSFPLIVSQKGVDSNGVISVEFYPYSETSELINYVYWKAPADLEITDTIPPQIDPYILKEGALIDLYRYLKAEAYKAGQVEIGQSWRNDEFAQETRFEKRIQEAVKTDRGVDDLSFILTRFGSSQRYSRDITNAHDIVYNRWPM